ncbi:MAG: SDR family NAD(P)-dependent oxidoreductase [Candidatus Saelkia tenebricola]|nr:SDR family NAD(P)-dependent oxidoreductase [Candidatus Saelkia tenebricola]
MKILVTGGAGFIGSYLVDGLIKNGYEVIVYDNLEEQVHQGKTPSYLNKDAQYVWADVGDYDSFKKVLSNVEGVFHFASMVGVGQSQYRIKKYMEVNDIGTANLWDILVNNKHKVKKVIVSASMSSYGEGLYNCKNCGSIKPPLREEDQLKNKDWELYCPHCRERLTTIPTGEKAPLSPNSIYALSKRIQEDISLLLGKTYDIPVASLRFFNAYGARQSLSNPYTGVCAIFISRLKNDKSPVVFEDGNQSRDFISVHDIVRAAILALEKDEANYEVCNIGSGSPIAIKEMGYLLSRLLNKDIKPSIPGSYRKGDVRYCYADIANAKRVLGWSPEVDISTGLKELIEWAKTEPSFDEFDKAYEELIQKKLLEL